MRKRSSIRVFIENVVIPLQCIFMLAVGFIILVIRNPDPLLNPIIYTEDGQWTGLALTFGWLHTFINAKDGYFVWGNLILLFFAEKLSAIFCGNSLVCLPQTIALFSYLFYSSVAVLAWQVTRQMLPTISAILVFILTLFIPLGDSSNEIIGRLSNIGYSFVFICILLVFARSGLRTRGKFIVDVLLILCIGTNPVCILVVIMAPVVSFFLNSNEFNLRSTLFDFKILLIGSVIVVMLIAWRALNASSTLSYGQFQTDALIEVALARSIIYPFIFPWYSKLTDQLTVLVTALLLSFCLIMFLVCDRNLRTLVIVCFVSFILFLLLTLYMRQNISEFFYDYRSTFPDRYFIGLNCIFLFVFCVLSGNLSGYRGVRRVTGFTGLVTIGVIFLTQIPWLVELREPRMPIAVDKLFWEEICLTGLLENEKEHVILPIMFDGWEMIVPADIANDARGKLDCSNYRKSFFVSDSNWDRGVARNVASFFLPNTREYQNYVVVGAKVQFANGDVREIIAQQSAEKYLNVFVDSPPLNTGDIEFPRKLRVVE